MCVVIARKAIRLHELSCPVTLYCNIPERVIGVRVKGQEFLPPPLCGTDVSAPKLVIQSHLTSPCTRQLDASLYGLRAMITAAAAFSLYTFVAGVVAHVAYYRHGEWDRLTVRICATYFSIVSIVCMLSIGATDEWSWHDLSLWLSSLSFAVKLTIPHLAGIFSSITIYRLFFHRLRRYPGPFLASLTGWYWTYLFYRSYHVYDEMKTLHDKYGDFVRIGKVTH